MRMRTSEILAHAGDSAPTVRGIDDYIGSPMYEVIPEHGPALVAVVLLAAGAWLARRADRRGGVRAGQLVERYRGLPTINRFLVWLLMVAGAVHAGLVLGHEPGGYTIAYAIGAASELAVALRILLGRPWRLWAGLVLGGSLGAFFITNVGGEPPDQVGLATKLVEIAALWIVLTAPTGRRLRRIAGSAVMVLAMVVVAAGAWAGAFIGVDGSHHVGEAAEPGTLIPTGVDRLPTQHEIEDADALYAATLATVARYRDPAVAAEAGYNVANIVGTEFHAANERYQRDGRILDTDRPENLIYAATATGPVLIGVMYEMEGIGTSGPAVGGPLTVWHAHDHVCFSLVPPGLAGLTSPFGVCPLGSVTIPVTNEMIHVWTVPGAEERFGHLQDEWLDDYLAALDG